MNRAATGGLALALLTLLGCGRDVLGTGGQKTNELRIRPGTFDLYIGQSFTFDVLRVNGAEETSLLGAEDLALTSKTEVVTVGKDGKGTAVGAGTSSIAASYLGLTGVASATVRNATLDAIAVTPPMATVEVGGTQALQVVGTLSDGSTIDLTAAATGTQYTSSSPEVATVSAGGIVTGVAGGEATIQVTHDGLTALATIQVPGETQKLVAIEIRPASLQMAVGENAQLEVIGTFESGGTFNLLLDPATYPLALSASDPNVASINIEGVVQARAPGISIVQAQIDGLVAVADVEVRSDAELIDLIVPRSVVVAPGESAPVRVIGLFSDGSTADITIGAGTGYQIIDTRFATVTAAGVVTGVREGRTTLIVTNGPLTRDVLVEIDEGRVLERLLVTPPAITMQVNDVVRLQVTAVYSDGSQTDVTGSAMYRTSPNAPVAVSTNGFVLGLTPGTGNIEVSFGGIATNVRVVVGTAQVIAIEINPPVIDVPEGDIFPVVVVAFFADGTAMDVTFDPGTQYIVDDPMIAQHDGAAAILGLSAGETTLRVTFGGVTGTAPIIVLPSMQQLVGITLNAPNTIPLGQRRPYTVTAQFSDGSTQNVTSMASVQSSAPSIVRATTGVLTALNPGSATISVFFMGFGDTRVVQVTSVNDPVVSIFWSVPSVTVPVNGSEFVELLGTTASGATVNLSNDPAVVIGISGGINVAPAPNAFLITGVTNGPAQVTATFNGLVATLPVTVTGGTTVIGLQIIAPATLPAGTTGQLFVLAFFSDGNVQDVTNDPGLTITTMGGAVATMGSLIIAVQPGTGTIQASFGGETSSVQIIVTMGNDPVVSLEFVPPSLSLGVGESATVQLFATLMSGAVVDVTFDPNVNYNAMGPIDGIPQGGALLITGLSPGMAQLTASLGGQTAQLPITISNSNPTVVGLILNAPPNLDMGIPATYRVIAQFSDGTSADVTNDPGVMVFVQNPMIFTAANGVLTPVSVGTTGLGVTFMGFAAMRQITVNPNNNPVIGLQWVPGSLNIPVGQTQSAQLFGVRMAGPPIDLSQNPGTSYTTTGPITIAPAVAFGMDVTGNASGAATVEASFGGFSATLQVTVGAGRTLVGIRVEPATNLNLNVGQTQQLTVIGLYSDGTEETETGAIFLSSDPGIASVSPTGLVTAVSGGQAGVLVQLGAFADVVTVNVSSPAPIIMSVNPDTIATGSPTTPIAVLGANFSPSDTIRFNGSPRPTTFVNPGRLNGAVPAGLLANPGTITVDVSGPNGVSNAVTIQVGDAPNITSFSPSSVIAGSSVEVIAVGSGLTGLSFNAPAGLTVTLISSAPDGSSARFLVAAASNMMEGGYSIGVSNAFGTDTIIMVVRAQTGLPNLTVTNGQTITLSGTNAFNTITVQTGGRINGVGNEPLALIASGGITIRGTIDVSGNDGGPGFTDPAAGGSAGPGGAGGGGGGDGNAPTGGVGGAGAPTGFNGSGGSGAGT
ncbi:MAG: Ig-like domain-containing protein, partial [Deltaproteobacteria bacterium]